MATSTKKTTTKSTSAKPAAKPEVEVQETGAAAVEGVTRPVRAEGEGDGKIVKKDLIDRVIARSGVKPRYVRPVVDALLVELGEMLEEAETMQLQPLGTVKVQRRKDVGDGEVIITKVKRKKDTPDGDDPLAAAAE